MTYSYHYPDWIEMAEEELRCAIHISILEKPAFNAVCNHTQQCAEKALKAFLIYHKQKVSFTHDLNDICKECKKIDPSFQEIISDSCFVSSFGFTARYPSSTKCEKQEALETIHSADRILNFVKSKINTTT